MDRCARNPRVGPACRSPTGFTLVELLVVIGIIALLISILLPALTTVRRAGARTACAAQLHDLGSVFQMYLNDSKGLIPARINAKPTETPPDPTTVGLPTLYDAFDRYGTKNHKIWTCPADTLVEADLTADPSLAGSNRYFDAWGTSYEYNFYMNVLSPGQPFLKILKDAENALRILPTQFRVFNDLTRFHGPAKRNGNMNFLFADWHVSDLEGSASGAADNPGGKPK